MLNIECFLRAQKIRMHIFAQEGRLRERQSLSSCETDRIEGKCESTSLTFASVFVRVLCSLPLSPSVLLLIVVGVVVL